MEEVSSKWGRAQVITGPVLIIPYAHRWTDSASGGQQIPRSERRHATFLPDELRVKGKVETEIRQRGIFSVPVYKLSLDLRGVFPPPDLRELGIDPATVDWTKAQLSIGIADARAIQEQTAVDWNGRQIPFLPGIGYFKEATAGVHASIGRGEGGRVEFSFPLALNGSEGVSFVPFGREMLLDLESTWSSPSFQGNWLPSRRTVSRAGFSASWAVPFLGRNYPQAWTSQTDMREPIDASRFGVELIGPVDAYRMAERSVKYAGLFILLTFASIWLNEVLAGMRVHPIQYLMVGAALCLFYLLELSLAEHLGFGVSYLLASVAVVGLISGYSLVMLRSSARAAVLSAVVGALYAYLYVLLSNEDYALLVGSVGLFAILAAVMFLTRRVDWHSVGGRAAPSISAR